MTKAQQQTENLSPTFRGGAAEEKPIVDHDVEKSTLTLGAMMQATASSCGNPHRERRSPSRER